MSKSAGCDDSIYLDLGKDVFWGSNVTTGGFDVSVKTYYKYDAGSPEGAEKVIDSAEQWFSDWSSPVENWGQICFRDDENDEDYREAD